MSLPPHLEPTHRMLTAAFGARVPPQMVRPVMRVLYDHMSDRNLAELMAHINGGDAPVWLNEVYKAASISADDPEVVRARATLAAHGLAEWLEQP